MAWDRDSNSSFVGGTNLMATTPLSQSNQGTGPHEISPIFALAPTGWTADSNAAFPDWYTANPTNRLEQANMELAWIMAGRIDNTGATPRVIDGRWGDASALWFHRFNGWSGSRADSCPSTFATPRCRSGPGSTIRFTCHQFEVETNPHWDHRVRYVSRSRVR